MLNIDPGKSATRKITFSIPEGESAAGATLNIEFRELNDHKPKPLAIDLGSSS